MSAPSLHSLSSRCLCTMRSAVAFVVVTSALVVLAGCGDLSQEDLLFRAGVPNKAALALTPPGIEDEVAAEVGTTTVRQQGLKEACGDGQLLCTTRNLSRGFNGLTFFLLDVVDTISGLPPTLREPRRRVWGPHFDAAAGLSYRFEMTRGDDGFDFCLHAARGQLVPSDASNALKCDDDDGDSIGNEVDVQRGTLVEILSGSFLPSAIVGDAARLGRGTMQLQAGRQARFSGEQRFARTVDFVFDNTDGATVIDIDLLGTVVDGQERDAAYHYDRSVAGDGRLVFEVFDELIAPELLAGPQQLEHITLQADWNVDRAGRASGVVDGGNTERDFVLQECWDAQLDTVYVKDIFDVETGDQSQCVDVDG